MIASGRIACFWPGLAAAWHRGNTTSVAISIGSMWLLCALLLATFVWPQWMSVWLFRSLWMVATVFWVFASVRNQWQFKRLMLVAKPLEAKDSFLEAQTDYLAGNWFDAEAKLLQILHEFPRDAESQLMLVGVLRRTKRYRPGLRRLAHLETLDSAARWRHEIRRERELIELRMAEELEEETKLSVNADSEGVVTKDTGDASATQDEASLEERANDH